MKDYFELIGQGHSPLLVLALVIAAWVGKGAFFAWHEGLAKFRNRRVSASGELARTVDGLGLEAAFGAGLKDDVERAIFERLVGVRVDRAKRQAAVALFSDAHQPVQFDLLRAAWPYLHFSERSVRVKPLRRWRWWRYAAATGAYMLLVVLAALWLVGALVFWTRDRALAVTAATEVFGFLLMAWLLLQGIWAYRAAETVGQIAEGGRLHEDDGRAGSGHASALNGRAATQAHDIQPAALSSVAGPLSHARENGRVLVRVRGGVGNDTPQP